MNALRTVHAATLAALSTALATGCSTPSSDICPTPLSIVPALVYPKSGARLPLTDHGVILYGNTAGTTVPITVVGEDFAVDALPTSVPSPLPSPTATPPAGQNSWGPIQAVEVPGLVRPGEYDVNATVTQYSCTTQHQEQVKIGDFKLI